MLMHDPPHPGAFIRRQCLEPLDLTVTEAAKGLAVSRNTLSMLLKRPPRHIPRDGHPVVGGIRRQPRKLADPANAVRPLARAA